MALSAPSPMPPSPRTPAALQPEKTVPPVPPVREASFAGEWFYAPSIEKPDPLLYAPEDIELRLTEKDGILNGEYRGRYKAPETGVPEDVVFKIQGKSSAGSSAALTWTSSDGAAGEINLNISRSDLMKVTWWATQLGRRPGLSSGAATLLRQQTP